MSLKRLNTSRAHPAHVSTLSGPGNKPVSGRLCETISGGLSGCPGFPLPFGRRRWLLGPSCSRRRIPPSLRSACRTRARIRTATGFPRSTRARCDRGRAPPKPRDCGVLRQPERPATGACRFSAASPAPRWSFPSAGFEVTRHQQGFTCVHPSDLPLRLWFPDGTGTLGLDHLSFAPRRYQRRTSGWGQAVDTGPELHLRHRRTSNPVHSLASCDLVSHRTSSLRCGRST